MILHKDRLRRFELCDGEAGLADVERFECLEHLKWGIDVRRISRPCFPLNSIEEYVMERPVFLGRQ